MTDQAITILLAVIGFLLMIVVALAGAAFKVYLSNSGLKTTISTKNSDRLDKIEDQLLLIDFQVKPMWAKAQKQISDELHHPHAKDQEADHLIDKLENLTINEDETERLKDLFIQRSQDETGDVSEREKALAGIMPVIMDLTLADAAEAEAETVDIELVGVKKLPEGEK